MKPSPFAQQKRQQDVRPSLKVGDWYNGEGGDQVARRHQVWGLIGWYHAAVVEPQLGFRGAFRRLGYRLAGWLHWSKDKRIDYRKKLMSPWDLLEIRAMLEERERLRGLD